MKKLNLLTLLILLCIGCSKDESSIKNPLDFSSNPVEAKFFDLKFGTNNNVLGNRSRINGGYHALLKDAY